MNTNQPRNRVPNLRTLVLEELTKHCTTFHYPWENMGETCPDPTLRDEFWKLCRSRYQGDDLVHVLNGFYKAWKWSPEIRFETSFLTFTEIEMVRLSTVRFSCLKLENVLSPNMMKHLANSQPLLQHLDLSGNNCISDVDVAFLVRPVTENLSTSMTRLRSIYLNSTTITANSLTYLNRLPCLKVIQANDTLVTEYGVSLFLKNCPEWTLTSDNHKTDNHKTHKTERLKPQNLSISQEFSLEQVKKFVYREKSLEQERLDKLIYCYVRDPNGVSRPGKTYWSESSESEEESDGIHFHEDSNQNIHEIPGLRFYGLRESKRHRKAREERRMAKRRMKMEKQFQQELKKEDTWRQVLWEEEAPKHIKTNGLRWNFVRDTPKSQDSSSQTTLVNTSPSSTMLKIVSNRWKPITAPPPKKPAKPPKQRGLDFVGGLK